ncbi:MAG TPA: type I restriction endonuclease [Chloroflexota bacterium]|nr:type I restriction endonuclease [Chloroflexota bacterium]
MLLLDRLRAALLRINPDPAGQPWLDDARLNQAVAALERLGGGTRLIEANRAAFALLLDGTAVDGVPERDGGRAQTVHFIDFERPENNDFLVMNQFRVDVPGRPSYIVPDLVLFVNGIPLVVVECKSPAATNPMEEGITQLLRYSNQRDWVDANEGSERLFYYNQLVVSTFGYGARVGTVGASYEHFLEWKDTSPVPLGQAAAELGVDTLSSQQLLIAGMLRKEHLLDLIRNFTVFSQVDGHTVKLVAHYQQFRAVHLAIGRLQTGQTRLADGDHDRRGGIIWHTQGSGKSLTMVFLVRKMRTLSDLRRFKVVVITDRIDLEDQLSATATLTGETVVRAGKDGDLRDILGRSGPDLVFAKIQKYQVRDEDEDAATASLDAPPSNSSQIQPESEPPLPPRRERGAPRRGVRDPLPLVAEDRPPYTTSGTSFDPDEGLFPELNRSTEILVLVDEAHRSHTSSLHANLSRALPNCARIGFTGTPIIMGDRKKTEEIFGPFIDRYTIQQSEADGATVPILYEGRKASANVSSGRDLDKLFDELFGDNTPEDLEKIKARYATLTSVLEAEDLIAKKATDILRHYVDAILPTASKPRSSR